MTIRDRAYLCKPRGWVSWSDLASFPTLVLILGLFGCDSAPELANYPWIQNSYADTVPRWTAVEEVRLGKLEGQGPEVFGRIYAIEADGDGRIFVLDGLAQSVRVFSAGGEYLRSLGRKGEGPGELLGGNGLAIGPEGLLWVWDVRNRRFSVFDTSGAYVRMVRTRLTGFVEPWRGGFGTDGFLYDFDLEFVGLDALAPYFGRTIRFTPYRIDPVDGGHEELSPFEERLDLTESGIPRPLGGRLTFARDPAGFLLLANTSVYQIVKTNLLGDTVLMASVETQPPALNPRDVDSVLSVPWGTEGRRLKQAELPKRGRIIKALYVASDGRIFLARAGDPELEGQVYDVFDPNGLLIAKFDAGVRLLTIPRPFIRGDLVYGVIAGALDEQYLVRLRIQQ